MKLNCIRLVLIMLLGIIFHISCKKENSCEGCADENKPPVAIAGPDQVITLPIDSISLDGSTSSDPDGMISEWLWKKISGPASFNIINAATARTIVKNINAGVYHFELMVRDDGGLSAKDTIQFTVTDPSQQNRPPVANAGGDQTITLPTNSVTINGSASTDPDNNITNYQWTKISGPVSFNITNQNVMQPQLINLVQGVYQFELKVTDAGGLFSEDTIQITVNHEPTPPCNPGTRPFVNAQLVPFGTLSNAGTSHDITIASAADKILFAGRSTVNIYDVSTASWSAAQLSEARARKAATVLGNKIFFAGGWPDANPNNVSSRVDIYDASSNSWSISELSWPRAALASSANNNKILFAGGLWGFDVSVPVVDIYNTVSNSWSTAMLCEHRIVGSATIIGDKIYFAGGEPWYSDGNMPSSTIDIYNTSSNTWSVSELSLPRAGLAGIAVGNKNYWAGGWNYSGVINSVEIRDATTQSSTFECLFQPNAYFDAVLKNNKIVFFTGSGAEKNKFDIYDITTDTWSIGVLPQNIEGAAIISVNNTIYVAGGYVNGVLSNQVWKLEF